ncbi:hypothetical protein ACFS32_08535 [Novosphingobium pokkalii]|uniref:hypothetical protein n=1 Tax=Novosphingobium pokkalii TaxID=1770194 RepID=UPI00363A8CAA
MPRVAPPRPLRGTDHGDAGGIDAGLSLDPDEGTIEIFKRHHVEPRRQSGGTEIGKMQHGKAMRDEVGSLTASPGANPSFRSAQQQYDRRPRSPLSRNGIPVRDQPVLGDADTSGCRLRHLGRRHAKWLLRHGGGREQAGRERQAGRDRPCRCHVAFVDDATPPFNYRPKMPVHAVFQVMPIRKSARLS